jgi:hypothetical protein
MPDEPVALGQVEPRLLPVVADQAELDPLRDLGEQGEVGATAVELRTERVRGTGPDGHMTSTGTHGPPPGTPAPPTHTGPPARPFTDAFG